MKGEEGVMGFPGARVSCGCLFGLVLLLNGLSFLSSGFKFAVK
jgi:hypothetical protein